MLARLLKDDRGATAIEYGLLVALLATASVGILQAVSGSLINSLATLSEKL